jgi:protease-4
MADGQLAADAGRVEQPGRVRRVLRFIGHAIRNYFVAVGVFVTALPILIGVLIATAEPGGATRPRLDATKDEPAPLTLQLEGKIAQRDPGFAERILSRLFAGERAIYLPEIRSALRRAKKDPRVARLSIAMTDVEATPAEWTELRRLLVDFKEGGKRIDVLVASADDWGYYAASAADRLLINPASSVSIPGPTFTLVYFGEALRKLGVGIEVLRAGKYKSAFEPLVLDAPSPEALEEYRAMQGSLLDHIVAEVAKGRKKDQKTVREWFKKSVFSASEAVELGLVDGLGHTEELEALEDPATAAKKKEPVAREDRDPAAEEAAKDEEKAPPPEGSAVSVAEYFRATEGEPEGAGGPQPKSVTDEGGIALIEAVGEIHMVSEGNSFSDEDGITPGTLHKELRWAGDDDDVKAVVFRVSSPGGSAVASDMIWKDVKELAAKKPVVVSMGAYAASGGYYISVPAQKLIAEPTTITGSIGVIGMLPKVPAFPEKYGVSFHVVSQSDRVALLNPGVPSTDEDKAVMQKTIDETYDTFVSRVAEGRKMKPKAVDALGQGRVYTGVEAKDLGLVDELGGVQLAFDTAKKLAGLDPKSLYPILRYEDDRVNLRDCLRNPLKMLDCLDQGDTRLDLGFDTGLGALSPVAPALPAALAARLAGKAQSWLAVSRREGTMALWPGYLGLDW